MVLAVEVNPLDWLGGAAAGVAADGWKAAMIGLWSAGLWLLQLAFTVVDAFTTPEVSATGPLAGALPMTLWLGGAVAGLLLCVQLVQAIARQDGAGLGRLLLGIGQFGLVWAGFLAVGGALVVAAGALAQAILSSMLQVDSWQQVTLSQSWPRQVNDTTAATVLGICSLLMLIPASLGYLLIMLVREAALVILLATTPISAAGLLAESTKAWFWKSLRWFITCLLIAPVAALVLGVGVALSNGVVQGAGTDTVAAAGSAVVGCVLVLVGALCPLVLFKLLAFVDPGSGSGAALRQSIGQAGGMAGLLRGGPSGGTSAGGATSAASQSDGGGRSQGEAAAETGTSTRLAGMLGSAGAGVGAAVSVGTRAGDLGSDVLGAAGIGDPGDSGGYGSAAADRPAPAGAGGDHTSPGGAGQTDPASPPMQAAPVPTVPSPLPPQGMPGGGGTGPGTAAPSGAGAGAGGGAGVEAAAVAL